MGRSFTIRLGTNDIRGRSKALEALNQGGTVEAHRVRKYEGKDERSEHIGSTKTPGRLGALAKRAARGISSLTESPLYDYVDLRIREPK